MANGFLAIDEIAGAVVKKREKRKREERKEKREKRKREERREKKQKTVSFVLKTLGSRFFV